MKVLFALILVWISCAASKKKTKACPKGFKFLKAFRTSCYKFVVKTNAVRGLNWTDARKACKSDSGDLLSVANELEMRLINLESERFVYHRQHLWIGLNDQRDEDQFVWSDGTPFNQTSYKNWGPGEPNNHDGAEHCVVMFNKVWEDSDCAKEYGYICETDIDECSTSNPCLNGADCSNTPGSYYCTCQPGFTGENCGEDIDECSTSKPCLNKGHCTNTLGSYNCTCQPGFTGSNCGDDVNECRTTKPCQNGGTCKNLPGSYKCICKPGFSGKDCQNDFNPIICSTGWTTYGNSCYKFSTDTKNWTEARAYCKIAGGFLVKIDDEDEQHLITVEQIKTEYPRWIGLHDTSKEGNFTWVYDNTVPTHTHWGTGEPNNRNYNEDCVAVWGAGLAGYWHDDSCNAWNKYICEKNVADWSVKGCFKNKKKKPILKIFRKFRIEGLVDECKEEAEKRGYHVFGVGVEGKGKIKHTVCVTTKNGRPRKNGKYGKVDKKGCKIDAFGLGAGKKPRSYFVYTRVESKRSKGN
ncbi:hypothetical protein ACROYT_G024703 [Oculina patagonica]